MGSIDGLTTEIAGRKVGEWFDANGVTTQVLRDAIATRKPLLVQALQAQGEALTPSQRALLDQWGADELLMVLQSLAETHPEHAKSIFDAWWTFLVPQVEEARRLLHAFQA